MRSFIPRQSRGFWPLWSLWTGSFLADGAMIPFLVLWAHREVGLSVTAAGALFTALAAGELIGGLVGGGLADRIGRRPVLVVASVAMAAGYGSLAFVHAPLPAVLCILAAGLFESAFHPTTMAAVADVTPDHELERSYGLLRVGTSGGKALGPALGAVLALTGLSTVFAGAAVLLALGALVVLLRVPETHPRVVADAGGSADDADTEREERFAIRLLVRDRRLGALVLGGALFAILWTWFEAVGLVFLHDERGLSTSAFGALFAVGAVLVVTLQLPLLRWIAPRGTGWALVAGALAQGAGLALLAIDGGIVALAGVVLLTSLGQMAYGAPASTLVARIAPAGMVATYQAAASTAADIAGALGPLSGLWLFQHAGANAPWLAAIPVALAAALLSRAAARGRERNPATSELQVVQS